ncbi:MAG TPA: VOC family protein [Polyangiaceae bacterium]|nr:VOC family protein [Polyangiaceae bacterium]
MQPPPPDWPRISTALYYENGAEAIDWLCRAFGFEVRIKVEGEGGRLEHSELVFGGGLIMVGEPKPEKFPRARPPGQAGGANTQNMMVYVDDIEAHYRRARAAGATIITEPKTVDHGAEYWEDRGYECEDRGGHRWWFYQRRRNPPPKA